MVNGGEYLLFPGELDLQLGGVYVHVHRGGMHAQMQITHRVTAAHEAALVALLQSPGQQAGADGAAVEVKMLLVPGGPGDLRRGDVAADIHLAHIHRQAEHPPGQVLSAGCENGGQHFAVAGGGKALTPVLDETEGDLRLGNGDLGHHVFHIAALGDVLFEKFGPGGDIKKQVPDDHGGAHRAAGLAVAGLPPPLQGDLDALGVSGGAGEHIHPGHRGNGGQRLAPEAQGADGFQVSGGAHLGGGMAQKRGAHILGQDALSVIGDPEIGHAAVADLHRDVLRPGVHGVFHQLLGHGAGPLHHLARGDEIGHLGRHLKDLGHINTPLPAWSADTAVPAPRWG